MSAFPHFKVSVDGRKATIYLERSFKVDCGFKHNQNTKNTRGEKYSYNILLGHFKSIFTYIDINGNFKFSGYNIHSRLYKL